MQKFIRYSGTLIFLSAMVCLVGFCHGRTGGDLEQAKLFGTGLKWTLYAAGVCMAYMGAVGVYHTILAVTGLDGGPGLVGRVTEGPEHTRLPAPEEPASPAATRQ